MANCFQEMKERDQWILMVEIAKMEKRSLILVVIIARIEIYHLSRVIILCPRNVLPCLPNLCIVSKPVGSHFTGIYCFHPELWHT